jgi:inner membrane transporter RhtA
MPTGYVVCHHGAVQVSGRSFSDRVPAQVLVLGGVASVQFGSAVASQLFDRASPSAVVLLRLAFGAVIMLALLRPRLSGRSRSDWLNVIAFGLVLAGMNLSFYLSLDRLPLGAAVTVEFVGPLTLAVVGSRRLLDLLWIAMAAVGVVVLGFGNSHESGGSLSITGILLALLAGAFWACYIVMSKRVGQRFASLDGLAIALLVGAIAVLPATLSTGGHGLSDPTVLVGGLGVALLSSVIPYSLELTALRRLPAPTFGLLMSLEPAVAALAGALILHQPLTPATAAAIVLVVAASAGSTLSTSRIGQPVPVD